MIGDPTLYKVKNFGSSKMFVTRVFCAYVITLSTAISLDWCKIETTWNHFYLQSRLCPIDWCHCCEGHVTILLTVLRFLASRSHTNSRKRGLGNVHGRGTGHGSKGAHTGVTALPASTPIMYFYHLLAGNGLTELWLRGGVSDKTRFIPLHVIAVKVGKPMCEGVLPATHVSTGCDITSKFGTKAADIKAEPVAHLKDFGRAHTDVQHWVHNAEKFLVQVLSKGKHGIETMDRLRFNRYHHIKSMTITDLPPTSCATEGHIQRAFYATYMQVNAWETFHWTHKTMGLPWKANVSSQRNAIVICQIKCLWNVTVWNVPLAAVLVKKETSAAAYFVNVRQTVSVTNAKTLMVLFWQSRCGSYKHWESEKWC